MASAAAASAAATRHDDNDNDNDSPTNEDENPKTAQLKSALWLSIGRLVDATTLSLGTNATPRFIGALTELVWHQVAGAAGDVEAFARHAGRTVVAAEDVLLLARRNDELKAILVEFLEGERRKVGATESAVGRGGARGKGRGRGTRGRGRRSGGGGGGGRG